MQFDWTTFALEILNFLVLLWILKRFLYRPVLDALDARKRALQEQGAQAARLRKEAEDLKEQCEIRLRSWEKERELARQALEQELAQTRAAALEKLNKQLADERGKSLAQRQAADAAREKAMLQETQAQAYRNASAMLQRLAMPALTKRIVSVLEEDLRHLPEEERAALRRAATEQAGEAAVEVASAHPLDPEDRQRITQALSLAANRALGCDFRELPELLAGLRISTGQCVLHANLADELEFFNQHGNRD